MLDRLAPWKRNLALAALAVLSLWFCWTIRAVLNPLVLGYLLAYIVHPMVFKLERRGWSRRSSANIIFALFGAIGVVFSVGLFVQGRTLAREFARSEVWDGIERRVESAMLEAEAWLPSIEDDAAPPQGAPSDEEEAPSPTEGEAEGETVPESEAVPEGELSDAAEPELDLIALGRDYFSQLSQEQAAEAGIVALRGAGGAWAVLRRWFGSLFAFGTLLFLLPLYTYFLLFELDRIHTFVRRYLRGRARARISRVGEQIGEVLANFFRGRLVVCFVKGLILTGGLLAVGIDYALLIGMASGFLSLLPFVGPFLGFLFALLVGLIDPSLTPFALLLRAAIVFGVAELIEGYVLVPKILGDSLGLHPVVVLVSVFAGGAALGMFGFLIALPLTASIVILVRELVLPALADFADEDEDGEGEEEGKGKGKEKGEREPPKSEPGRLTGR